MNPAQAPIRSSTQQHLDIEDVKDNIVILKNGACCLILQTTAVNFNLLSETEQDAIIYAYAGLLNSLSFPIQIYIRSQQKDISSYLALLKKQLESQKSEKMKKQIKLYQKFIEKIVKQNEVLDKKFYIIVPFSALELGVSQSIKQTVLAKENKLPFPKEYILEKAKTNLYPKRDHLIKQFQRLGLKTIQLNTKQLIELFYIVYNPESKGQKLGPAKDYSAILVNPAVFKKPKTVPLTPKQSETKTPMSKTSVSNKNNTPAVLTNQGPKTPVLLKTPTNEQTVTNNGLNKLVEN